MIKGKFKYYRIQPKIQRKDTNKYKASEVDYALPQSEDAPDYMFVSSDLAICYLFSKMNMEMKMQSSNERYKRVSEF